MNKDLQQIFIDYGLFYEDTNGKELEFRKVLSQIYYDWDSTTLKNFMNSICELETTIGDPFYDDD